MLLFLNEDDTKTYEELVSIAKEMIDNLLNKKIFKKDEVIMYVFHTNTDNIKKEITDKFLNEFEYRNCKPEFDSFTSSILIKFK